MYVVYIYFSIYDISIYVYLYMIHIYDTVYIYIYKLWVYNLYIMTVYCCISHESKLFGYFTFTLLSEKSQMMEVSLAGG